MEKLERVISYYQHEEQMVRLERANTRMWILCVILIFLFVATNGAWIYYESQFQVNETTVEQDIETGDGENTTVIGVGDYNGESKTDSQN